MRTKALSFAILTAASAAAAPLPFRDGFEPPQTGFSNWTTTRVNGANTLTQSPLRAWDETRSLTFTYAGAASSVQAAAVVDFSAAITTPFVRFWLFVPAGTAAAMANGSTLRLVKLGDALTGAAGSGGAAKVNLVLRKDSGGAVHLRVEYLNTSAVLTPLGTALTAPVTEGTWHFVELGYEPLAPRVRVFIDDPVAARIDAAPADLAVHNLLTAWVGLADAADAQATPLSLSIDAVQVATGLSGTSQAIAQHFNELESGNLTVGSTPPGKASAVFSTAGTTVTAAASPAAAHRGAYGLRIVDADGQAGQGGGAGESVRITATQGTLHRRFFWRPLSTNGLGSRTLATLSSSAQANRAMAEVLVAGNGTLSLGGYDGAAAYVTTPSTTVASTAAWHLVELLVTGLGTASGSRKLYLDGTLAAQAAGIDWSTVSVDLLLEGQTFSTQRTFQGTDDFDDLRVSRTLMPSRLAVVAPAMTDRACSAAVVIEARDSDGTPRGVVEPTLATLTATGVTGAFYADAACTAAAGTVQLAVGTSSATVYFKPGSAGSATLAATNVDYLSAPDTAAVASLATQLAIASAPKQVSAGACSSQALVQSRDAAGAAATVEADTPVALASSSMTLGFFSDPACVTAITSVTLPAGQSSAGFYFRDTVAAQPTVTASAMGLGNGVQTETVTAASPSKLVFTGTPQPVTAGACSAVVTVQAQDTYGNPATVTASTPVTFSSSSAAAAFFVSSGCGTAGATASIPAGQGSASIYFTDTRAGTPTLTASAAGFLNGTRGEAVVAAAPAKLVFTSPAQTVTAGACSVAAVIEAQDTYGNASTVTAAAMVALSSSPANVTFYGDATCGAAVGSVSIAAGSSSGSFWFISSAAGPVTLTADSAPLTSGSQMETISASGPTRLRFISGVQSVAAGSCSSAGLVRAEDSFGNAAAVAVNTVVTLTSSAATTRFSPTGACASQVTTVTIAASNDTAAFYFRDTVAGAPTITAAASGLVPASQTQTIRPAPPSQLGFASMPQALVAGACSAPIVAQARDGFGNPAAVVSNTTLALATTSPQGVFYSNATCTTALAQAVIPAMSSSVTLYYRDTRAAPATLTLSNAGLSAPTQVETVAPAPPARLVFLTMPQALTAGSCSMAATVEVRDQFGNASAVTATTTVALSSSSMSGTFHSDPACATEVQSVALGANGTQVGFWFRDPTAGMATVSAAALGLTDGTQLETFNAGPPAKLEFSTPPRTVTAGSCSAPLTAQLQDANGNPVTFAAATAVAVSTSSMTGALYSDAACSMAITQLTVPAGSGARDVYFKDTKAGPWGVTATAPGVTPAAQTVTVAPGPPARLSVLSAPQTIPAGACSAAVTVEVFDALDNPLRSGATTDVALSSSSATTRFSLAADCTGPVTRAPVPAGSSRVTCYFSDAKAGTAQLSFSVTGAPAATQAATFTPGPPVRLAFTSPPQTVSANTCSAPLLIEVQDVNGNASAPAGGTTVNLSSTSLGASFFSDPTCTTPVVSLALAGGAAAGTAYFKDLTLGTATLSASAVLLGSVMQSATIVTPAAPAKLAFATPPFTQEAGACSGVVIVEVKDQSGNSSPVTQSVDLTLRSMPGTATFHLDANCTAAIGKVIVPAGAYQALFHMKDPVAHAVTVSAAATGLTAATQDEVTTCPLATDGAFCDDLDLCNGRETCAAGACTTGTPPVCMDTEDCTIDACVPATGCSFEIRAGCCRPPAIAAPNLAAAVGVPYRIGPGARAALLRGTGPTRWAACDVAPGGFHLDATTGQLDWVPAAAGDVAVCLKATAACGEDTVRFTVRVAATPPPKPVAMLAVTPSQVTLPDPVRGDASASTGSGPLSFEWWWGDFSAPASGPRASHVYAVGGNYPVRLRVFDAVGQVADAEQRVAVAGPGCAAPPIARIGADALTGDGSLTTALRCDCSPVAGAVYRWSFGDGETAFGEQTTHTFAPGDWRVRLEVSAGGCSSSDTAEVRVSSNGQPPPTCAVTADPAMGAAPLHVAFAASFGSTGAPVATAAWEFSDGVSADALQHDATLARTLDAPGTLEATLRVTDAMGLTCRASAVVTATSVGGLTPPSIVSVPSGQATCGEAWSYGEGVQPAAVGSAPLRWSLGKNAQGAGHPSGMTIDEATGALSWTPDSRTRGPTRVTVVVQNEVGVAQQDFLVDVQCARGCGCGAGLPPGLLAVLCLALALRWRRRR